MRHVDASAGARLVTRAAVQSPDEPEKPWVLECFLRGEWRELGRFDSGADAVQTAIDMGMPPGDLGKLLRARKVAP